LIISYDTFRNHRTRLDRACDLVICDEGHRIKNASTATSRQLHAMTCTKRILLTGTPLQNNLMEFYTCVSFVNPGIFGSLADFKELFANPILKAQEPDATMNVRELGWSRATELKEITSQFIIRRTGSLLEESLPPRHEYLIFLKPSKLQEKIYKAFLLSGYVKETVRTFDIAHALSMILYLRQLLNHPDMIYFKFPTRDDMIKTWKAIKKLYPSDYNLQEDRNQFSYKMLFLDHILKECISKGDKLLVVSYFTQTLDYIQSYCLKKGHSYARLDGQTNIKNRIEIVDEFNSEESDQKLFLLSSKAGGVGLNIIGANRMILFDGDWNPSNDKQAMGRIWRFGQKKPVYIYRIFTAGTIEEKIYQRQTAKENLFQTLMNSKNKAQKFTQEYLEAIFTYSKTCETFKESDEISGQGSFLEGVNSDYISIIKRNIEDWKEAESQELDFLDAELGNYETGKRKFPDSEFNINKRAVKIK
jgi:SNF2 family DNA or RNA helicase